MEIPCSWPLHIRSSIANELRLTHLTRSRVGHSFAALRAAHMLLVNVMLFHIILKGIVYVFGQEENMVWYMGFVTCV